MTSDRLSRSAVLVTVLYGDEDVSGVRAMLEGVAPDQNICFLLLEQEQDDDAVRQASRQRLVGASVLRLTDAEHGGALERSAIAFAPRGRVTAVSQDLLVSLRERLLDGAGAGPADANESTLQAVTSAIGRRGCVVTFSGGRDQLPEATRLRELLGAHDGMVLIQAESGGPFVRLAPELGSETPIEVVVQPSELAYTLLEHAEPLIAELRPSVVSPRFAEVEGHLSAILQRVLEVTGQDFSGYKPATMIRRTIRRMHLSGTPTASDYLDQLREERAEVGRLFRDLLVGVTAFFRDPDAFDALSHRVLERLATSDVSTPARVWVAGCSTGEEVYTLAMLLDELADAIPSMRRVQLFATDVDEVALRSAREGRYPASRVANLTPERIARFFERTGRQFRVTQSLRDRVVFSRHDLTRDVPFSKLDLIVCRNVLIYLDDEVRDRLLTRFHHILRPGGTLFLGPSESLGVHEGLFRPIDAHHRIFTRGDVPSQLKLRGERSFGRAGIEPVATVRDREDVVRRMRSVLTASFAPRAVVVTEDGHIVAVSGDLSPILAVRDGAFVNSLSYLVHDGLRLATRTALREARMLGERVEHSGGMLQGSAGRETVTVVAEPLSGAEEEELLYLVVFRRDGLLELPTGTPEDAPLDARAGRVSAAIVERLESDLSSTRAELLRVSHDSDILNEELKATNEELTSLNEELQSGIEELEAARQELERVNAALAESNTDLTNLLASTGIPTIFLDEDGTVRRFNPALSRIYNVAPDDVGRPLMHFTHNAAEMPPLPSAADVRTSTEPIEHGVRLHDGTVYLRRVQPYESPAGDRTGIVVTFTDVTEREQIRRDLHESSLRLRQVIDAMFAFVGLLDLDGTLIEANSSPLELAGLRREDVIGLAFWDTAWWTHDEAVRARLRDAFARACTGEVVRYDEKIRVKDDELITIDFMLQPVERDGQIVCIVPSGVDVTHRVATEQRLREQHDLTRAITLNATTAILLLDPRGAIDLANPSATRMLGYPDDDLLGADLHALVHPPDASARTQCPGASCEVARACTRSHALHEHESVFIGRDGRAVPVAVSASAVVARDVNGRALDATAVASGQTGTVFEVRDLTEVVRGRRELAENEAQFRQMADVIPQMAWIANPDGEVFWYNRQFYAYTGVSPEEVEGWGWTRIPDPDMLPLVVERWRQSIATGTPFDMVFPMLGADGEYRPFLTRVNPLRGEDGGIRLWFGTNTDISDERERSEKLRRSERELHAITDALPDVILRLDRERRHVFVNAAMERVTGHRLSSVLGRTSHELGFPERLCEQFDAVLSRVFDAGHAESFEFECDSRGTCRSFLARVTPELDSSGDIGAVLVVARDRTAEVEAERALREADRRKDEFLATLAHELRNPLAPMRNGLEILRLTYDGDELGVSTQHLMERQVAHMTRLIDDLLDVSRIRLGKLQLRLGAVDMHRVLDDALEINATAWQDAGHELVRVLPEEPLRIRADQDRLAQVVSNLVNNAIKYTPEGGRIEVSLGREGTDAVIRVRDSGIGIAPDKLEHVFELFTQVPPREGGGTVGLGIGLALVRQLVELHQGTVVAESEGLGKGSQFIVRLPAAVLSQSPLPPADNERLKSGQALRVLVVDDNEDSADSLVTMLELLGHVATSAHTGEAALLAARTEIPDLVFADIGLPDITGYELAIAMREDPRLARVVLVALTGWGSDEHRRRSVDSGFDYHLTKPAAMDVIRRILARVSLELGRS